MVATPYAPISTTVQTGGIVYCAGHPMPASEVDLMDQANQNPAGMPGIAPDFGVPLRWENGLVASVLFQAVQPIQSNTSYVVLQGSAGDGVWYDISGCVWQGTAGRAGFLLFCTTHGTFNVLQSTQASPPTGAWVFGTRTQGNAPAANFFNPTPPPSLFRFVGKGTGAGSGSGTAVQVTIRYRPSPQR